MVLVMMAMLFMLKERLLNEESIPLLSCSDIEILLTQFFYREETRLTKKSFHKWKNVTVRDSLLSNRKRESRR
jgi:hypothetical protein